MVCRVTKEFTEYLRELAEYCASIGETEVEGGLLESANMIDADTDHIFTLQFQHIINSEMIRELNIEVNHWKVRAKQAERRVRRKKDD